MLKLENYDEIVNSPLQELTLSQIYRYISGKPNHKISVDDAYNIFVKNEESENTILVVAHLDRVLEKQPHLFRFEEHPKRIYGAYGWDDRAGIIAALELFKKYDIDLLFTTGEESGCDGAKQINPNKIRQYKMIFELDRHGNTDFINDCALGVLCNDDFTNAICYHLGTLGYVAKPTQGVYTDVGALRSKNKTAQMFYMSCGYYNEHTENEYLVLEELQSAIDKAGKIVEYVTDHPEVLKPFVPVVKPEPPKDEKRTTYRFPDYERFRGHYDDYDYDDCYCMGCDAGLYSDDLIDGKCPYCGGEVLYMDD